MGRRLFIELKPSRVPPGVKAKGFEEKHPLLLQINMTLRTWLWAGFGTVAAAGLASFVREVNSNRLREKGLKIRLEAALEQVKD